MKYKHPNWCIDLLRDEHLHSLFITFNKFYLTYSINYELYADADIEVWWALYPDIYKDDINKAKYGIYG